MRQTSLPNAHCPLPNAPALLGLLLALLTAAAAFCLPESSFQPGGVAAAQSPASSPPAPVGSCAGDLNGDRAVNGRDLTVLLSNFGTVFPATPGLDPGPGAERLDPLPSVQAYRHGDLNGDNTIDGQDLTVLLTTFGCREFEQPGFAVMGPPSDFVSDELEPWRPGSFTTENAQSRGGRQVPAPR